MVKKAVKKARKLVKPDCFLLIEKELHKHPGSGIHAGRWFETNED